MFLVVKKLEYLLKICNKKVMINYRVNMLLFVVIAIPRPNTADWVCIVLFH